MSTGKYPKPDRSDHYPQKNANREFYPEMDLSSSGNIFSDGRPYLVEDWVDKEMAVICATFYYSTIDIENWDSQQHKDYLDQHKLLSARENEFKNSNLAVKKIMDNSGNEMWSVTAVMADW